MRLACLAAALATLTTLAAAVDLQLGKIIDDVKCAADPSQSYALYVPSNYTAARSWPAIFAFSPMARGRIPVERFQEAAEKYGYIVAGSNNSRNGSWDVSLAAIRTMPADVTTRFTIDLKRVYTAGMSGGARVAMQVALASGKIAGVIACSAGFPDAQPRKSVPFVIFGTAGTDDFNYLEMRRLDRALTSPHRVVIFDGTHEWLTKDLATEAVAWLEVQAMKSGLRARDEALLEKVPAEPQNDTKADEKKERSLEQREERMTEELLMLEQGLGNPARRTESLTALRDRLHDLSRRAKAKEDSPDRRIARRVLGGTIVRSFEQIKDEEYRKLLDALR